MRFMAFAAIIVIATGYVGEAHGQSDSQADSEKAEFKRWIEYYQEVAGGYDFRLLTDQETKLQVSGEPLLTYAYPAGATDSHGAFFVWTGLGRPEVIGAIWSHGRGDGSRDVLHEFHSLSLSPLAPVRVGRGTWRPSTGIELKSIPGAPLPKNSAPLRLAQMRSLARQFTGFSTPHGREERLRTLDQPLFRYQSNSPDVIDGAVFGMFRDWDPDIMLLIEARKTDADVLWHYGIGRFNGCPLRLQYRGSDVWKEGLVPLRDPANTFYAAIVAIHRISVPDPE